jgi:hypothetical protein
VARGKEMEPVIKRSCYAGSDPIETRQRERQVMTTLEGIGADLDMSSGILDTSQDESNEMAGDG